MNFKFHKAITVELKLTTTPAAGVQINFLDVPQLTGKFIQGIAAYNSDQSTKTPNNLSVISSNAQQDFLMTFVEKNTEKYQDLPYYDLVPANNAGFIRLFKDFQLNINKSYCLIGGATAAINEALLFTFYYSDAPTDSKRI